MEASRAGLPLEPAAWRPGAAVPGGRAEEAPRHPPPRPAALCGRSRPVDPLSLAACSLQGSPCQAPWATPLCRDPRVPQTEADPP